MKRFFSLFPGLVVAGGVLTQAPNPENDAWEFSCRVGSPVYATIDGVSRESYTGQMGRQITIEGPQGRAYYAHLGTVKPGVREVKEGDVIGTCGNTGSWSTGPHVHYEFER